MRRAELLQRQEFSIGGRNRHKAKAAAEAAAEQEPSLSDSRPIHVVMAGSSAAADLQGPAFSTEPVEHSQAAAEQEPLPLDSRPADMVMAGSAAAGPLAPAASAEPVVQSQPPRDEHQALRRAAAGRLAAGQPAPQPARCVAIHRCMPLQNDMLMLLLMCGVLTAITSMRIRDSAAANLQVGTGGRPGQSGAWRRAYACRCSRGPP